MGITIHAAIEKTDTFVDWKTIADLMTWDGYRTLAALMSGVISGDLEPLYAAREIPIDTCSELSTDPHILRIMHHRSYLDLHEMREVYEAYLKTGESPNVIFEAIVDFMQTLENQECKTRFVFGFDD